MPAPIIAAGSLALRALPYLYRGAKAIPGAVRAGLGYFKPYQMSSGVRASGNQIIQSGKYAGQKFKDVYPNLYQKGNMPRFNITSTSKSNIALQSPFYFGAAMQGYDYLTDEAEQSVADGQRTVPSPATPGGPAGMTIEEGEKAGIIKDKKEKPDDAKITSDQIKSGELDDFIKERIDLFEKYIGDDTRKRTKTAGYNAMVQFGLNLATKRGSLVEGIAESAKEPLKEFAKLGNDLMDRAQQIKKAGIAFGFVDPGANASAEQFRVNSMKAIMAWVQKTKGAISEAEMQLFADASEGLGRTVAGNKLILLTAKGIVEYQQKLHKERIRWMKETDNPTRLKWEANMIEWNEVNGNMLPSEDEIAAALGSSEGQPEVIENDNVVITEVPLGG